jgi:uncharacterized protein (TIGR03437 family)
VRPLLVLSIAIISLAFADPTITPGGIVNASGYQTKLAPDTVFVIFGTGMGPAAIAIATAPNYPEALAGTSITFTSVSGGAAIPAKLVYSLAGQVSGLLPSSIAPGTYAVRVAYNNVASAPQNVTVVARSFGIATSNSAGSGTAQSTIGNVNGGLSLTRFTGGAVAFGGFSWTLGPAHPGDTLVLWGTGGGADAANDTGGTSGDQTKAGNFIVNVGGRAIAPLFAGASSGYPGLWQINFTLPLDITPDCFAFTQVSAGGELSNGVNLPIASAGQNACSDPQVSPAVLAKMDAGGNIVIATFGATKLTDQSTVTTVEEVISGDVAFFTATEWALLFSGPRIGLCQVYDRMYAVGGKDPGAGDGLYNAGAKLPLSGPNLTAGTALAPVNTVAGPSYYVIPTNGTLVAGKYTLAGTGGTQVGPFSVTADFPSSFTVTNFDSILSIDRAKPLTINWTSSGVATVQININTNLTVSNIHHIVSLNCSVPASLGTYTITPAALGYLLPVAASGTNFGGIGISGQGTSATFTAPLIPSGQTDVGQFAGAIELSKSLAVQ